MNRIIMQTAKETKNTSDEILSRGKTALIVGCEALAILCKSRFPPYAMQISLLWPVTMPGGGGGKEKGH
jgi:hypothetical protein